MDAFYASVEQRDNADLRGKAVAVGGGEKRGVLTTCSYEARKFGVRSAMPGYKAKELCPHIIFVRPRFDAYIAVSKKIREIFSRYTDLIEPLSLDEAYLDVTDCKKKNLSFATDIARAIKNDILAETGLTASAGVSYSKFIAKIASDIDKPNGLTVIKPHQAIGFIENLKIEKFYGVGKVTAAKMKALGIHTGKDLKDWTEIDLVKKFGKGGRFFYNIVRGKDNRPVKTNRERKSLAVERTSVEDMTSLEEIEKMLIDIVEKLKTRLDKSDTYGRTLTLKLKTAKFEIITRSRSVDQIIRKQEIIIGIALELLRKNYIEGTPIRLVGLTSSNFKEKSIPVKSKNQLSLDL